MEQRGASAAGYPRPTYGMSTAHGDLSGRAGGRANAGSVVGSTAGRAVVRGIAHRGAERGEEYETRIVTGEDARTAFGCVSKSLLC